MEVGLLGPLTVVDDGRELLPSPPKQRMLIAILALHAGKLVAADQLVEALWGQRPPASAMSALQGHVHALRKLLGAERIETRPPGYCFRLAPNELDVGRFEGLLRACRAARDPLRRSALAAEAVELFRGEPLQDFRYAPFAEAEIARLQELRLEAFEERFDAELALGRHAEVVAELQAVAAANPLREGVQAQLMLALYRSGRQAEALAQYRAARQLLVEELGLEPSPKLQQLNRDMLAQHPSLTPEGRAHVGNLRAEVDSFVGREPELTQLCELVLKANVRLVTLTGVGGSGKSRLALRAARRRLLGSFDDGVFFVELAPVEQPTLVVSAVAQALGVPDTAGSLFDALVGRLASAQTLLILDNFEHVLPAARDVSRLLAACSELRVLVTSRTSLHIQGEHELQVDPLDPADALQLFVDRAGAVRADFTVGHANSKTINEICRRLDFLPLAIELAATRIRVLPPEAMLQRLERPLELLIDGATDTPPRQRTLRDTIAWSHGLLDERERVLLRRLSVFRGGCGLTTAEAVCGLDADTLAGLSHLVEHSLLKMNWDENGEPRYELLETVREFAREQLEASGETAELERRHANHYAAFAEDAGPLFHGSEAQSAVTFARLTRESDNFRAVHTWSLRHDEADPALRILGSTWLWNWTWLGETLDWTTRLLALPSASLSTPARARALCVAEIVAWALGDLRATQRFGEEAVRVSREVGDSDALARSLAVLGGAHPDDPARGFALFSEAEQIAVDAGHAWNAAFATVCRALFSVIVGDAGTALDAGEEAAARFRAIDSPRHVLIAQMAIGFGQLQTGDLDAARATLAEAQPEFSRILNFKFANMCAIGVALAARFSGDLDGARRSYEQALSICEEAGDPANVPLCLEGLAAASAHDEPEHAARLLGAARAVFDSGRTPTVPGFEPLAEQTAEQLRSALGARYAPLFEEGSTGGGRLRFPAPQLPLRDSSTTP